jgi:hypothetical protein
MHCQLDQAGNVQIQAAEYRQLKIPLTRRLGVNFTATGSHKTKAISAQLVQSEVIQIALPISQFALIDRQAKSDGWISIARPISSQTESARSTDFSIRQSIRSCFGSLARPFNSLVQYEPLNHQALLIKFN